MTGNIIGVFILGVLAGWLAEWLFITFIMGKKQQITSMAEDTSVEAQKENNESSSSSTNIATHIQAIEEKKTTKPDDFIQLKGIGPKLSASIKAININRYDELAAFTGEALLEKLEASGAVIVNRPAFVHIPQQAALAAKGDWEALEVLKKSI